MTEPFLCIITPVFDAGLKSFKQLVGALQKQSLQNFINVAISNGRSPSTKAFVASLRDSKFIYDKLPHEKTTRPTDLLINLGKRRELCLKKYDAQRYLFLDADIKIVDDDYFKNLHQAHDKADILLTRVRNGNTLYPVHPINRGRIDMANFSFSKMLAKSYLYPVDYDKIVGYANDWRFFSQMMHHSYLELPFTSAEKNGNKTYTTITERFINEGLL